MMPKPRDLAAAREWIDKIPPRPEERPLAALVKVVLSLDSLSPKPLFNGDETELFRYAYGDDTAAHDAYRRALRDSGEDRVVRAFCISRLEKFAEEFRKGEWGNL